MDKPFANGNVPPNSTLEVKVSGSGPSAQQFFVATGTFELPDGSREMWTDTQLRNGLSPKLDALGTYVGRVDIHFIKSSTARLQMKLKDSSGTTIDSYDESVTQASDFDRTAILVVVRSATVPVAAAKKATKKSAKKAAKKPAKKGMKGGGK